MKLYEGGKLYNNKTEQWEAIKTTMSEIKPAERKKSTKSMYNRLLTVTEKKVRFGLVWFGLV